MKLSFSYLNTPVMLMTPISHSLHKMIVYGVLGSCTSSCSLHSVLYYQDVSLLVSDEDGCPGSVSLWKIWGFSPTCRAESSLRYYLPEARIRTSPRLSMNSGFFHTKTLLKDTSTRLSIPCFLDHVWNIVVTTDDRPEYKGLIDCAMIY